MLQRQTVCVFVCIQHSSVFINSYGTGVQEQYHLKLGTDKVKMSKQDKKYTVGHYYKTATIFAESQLPLLWEDWAYFPISCIMVFHEPVLIVETLFHWPVWML